MFDYIKIEGFRSFKKVELEMPRLAVLIGPNGGGKSNFLDLLTLMSEAGSGRLAVGVDGRGGYRNIAFGFDSSREVRVEFRFRNLPVQVHYSGLQMWEASEKKPYDIRFSMGLRGWGDNFRVWEEKLRLDSLDDFSPALGIVDRQATLAVFRPSTGSDPQIIERKSVEDLELAISQVGDPDKYPAPYAVLQQLQEWTFYRDIDVGPQSPVRQPAMIRYGIRLFPNGANLFSVLHSIREKHQEEWKEILEFLKTAYPDFLDLRAPAEGGDGRVHLWWFEKHCETEGISANHLSDGMLRLLCLIAILKNPDPPPLICIDGPELGLHPDWIELVADLLQDAAVRTQVIVATHSPQIMAKLEPEQVIIAEKVDGETHLKQLKTPDLENWLKDFNLAELWLSGEIGGRP